MCWTACANFTVGHWDFFLYHHILNSSVASYPMVIRDGWMDGMWCSSFISIKNWNKRAWHFTFMAYNKYNFNATSSSQTLICLPYSILLKMVLTSQRNTNCSQLWTTTFGFFASPPPKSSTTMLNFYILICLRWSGRLYT
jgi:hypothetical protein